MNLYFTNINYVLYYVFSKYIMVRKFYKIKLFYIFHTQCSGISRAFRYVQRRNKHCSTSVAKLVLTHGSTLLTGEQTKTSATGSVLSVTPAALSLVLILAMLVSKVLSLTTSLACHSLKLFI